MQPNTTPVPNALFDVYLKELKSAEIKVLLVIIRKTLGWADRRTSFGRKESDWISGGQLRAITGSSRRAISSAVDALVRKDLIEVLDESGNLLFESEKRKGKPRLFYRLSPAFTLPVENMGKSPVYPVISDSTSAKFAEDLSKKSIEVAQKLLITKETLQN